MKKATWKKLLIAALILFLVSAGISVFYIVSTLKAQKDYEKLKAELAVKAPSLEEIMAQDFTARDGESPLLPSEIFMDPDVLWAESIGLDISNPIDFEELQRINTDLYAWIRIEDTNIDYPIAQHAEQDDFYLNHDFYGNPQFAGTIYSEARNAKDFSDPVTVLYGHNMRNGSMFQNLHLFEDKEFFDEHPYVYIYTPEGTMVYEVVSAGVTDNRHILYAYDFEDEEVFTAYLEKMQTVSKMGTNVREDVELGEDSHILILSTCVGGNQSARYIVQMVRVCDGREEAEEK